MSFKLSLIFLCGLFAHSVYVNGSLQSIINEAVQDAPQDFVIALKTIRDVFEYLKEESLKGEEKTAIPLILKSINKISTDPKFSETSERILTEIHDTLNNHPVAHKTIIEIVKTFDLCLSYESPELSKFWKTVRKLSSLKVINETFPEALKRFMKLSTNASTKKNFDTVKNYAIAFFNEIERRNGSPFINSNQ